MVEQENSKGFVYYLLIYSIIVAILFIIGFFPSFNLFGSQIYLINPLIQAQIKVIAMALTFFGVEFIIFYGYYRLIKMILEFYDTFLKSLKKAKIKIERTLYNSFKGGL